MRQTEFVGEPLNTQGLLQRIQVFALDIFDQRNRQRLVIRNIPYHHRHCLQARHARRAPAAFARDNFKFAVSDGAHQNRLNHALCFDRLGQFFERILIHAHARLVFAGLQQIDGKFTQRVAGRGGG